MSAPLVGRDTELAAIAGAVAAASTSRSRVVSVEGPPGAGKTALVRAALDALGGEARVVRLHGDVLTADLRFAALEPVVELADDASALDAARALLARLGDLAGDDLVVLVAEDLQWFDTPSRQALAIAAGRLDHEPVLVLATARPDHDGAHDGWARLRGDEQRCVRVRVGPLEPGDVVPLAAAFGVDLDDAAARRLVEHTGGNALAIRTLLVEVPAAVLTRPGGSLPVPRELTTVIVGHLASTDPQVVGLVSALAVLGRPASVPELATLVDVVDPGEAAELAVRTGFVEWDDASARARIRFAHPVYERAVYDDLSPTTRRQLHQAAATITDRRSALAHRFAAAERSDEALASELETAAETDRGRDGPAAAARLLQWAAAVSPARTDRERRTLAAARLLLIADDPALSELTQEVEGCDHGPARDLVLGELAWQAGDPVAAMEQLERAATGRREGPADPASLEALVRLADHRVVLGQGQAAVDATSAAIARGISDAMLERQAWALRALGHAQVDGAVAALELLDERIPTAGAAADAPLLAVRGLLRVYALHPTAAIDDLSTAMRGSSWTLRGRRRAHSDLAQSYLAVGRWDEAVVHARMALELSDEEHQWELAVVHGLLATIFAARGDDAAATELEATREIAARYATPEGGVAVRLAAIARADAVEDHEAKLELTRVVGEAPMLSTLSLLHPAAAVRADTGDLDGARDLTVRLVEEAARRRLDMRATVADLRARIAIGRGEVTEAESELRGGLDGLTPDVPALLAAGLWARLGTLLRNQGRRREALEALRSSRALYDALGADPYLQRIDDELVGSGLGRPRSGKDRSPLDLTPRERDVVILVVDGATNKEAADQLFVSSKAIEYHLRNVYGKLGISSRRELKLRWSPDAD